MAANGCTPLKDLRLGDTRPARMGTTAVGIGLSVLHQDRLGAPSALCVVMLTRSRRCRKDHVPWRWPMNPGPGGVQTRFHAVFRAAGERLDSERTLAA